MYHLHVFIDRIQKTKKDIFETIVKDEDLRKIANNYLDTQTKFAKSMIDTGWDLLENSWKNSNKYFSKEYFPEAPYKLEPKKAKK